MTSFSSSAFSVGAFSELAFDFGSTPTPNDGLLGGGPGYTYISPYHRQREADYQRETAEEKRLVLQRIEDELAHAEQERLAALAADALEAWLQEEINRLRMERAWLIRQIDDEEAMFLLLMSRPFH